MRIRRLVLSCAVSAVFLTACGGVDGGVRVEGPAATRIPSTGPVYVTDWYGRAWQHPVEVDPTMRVTLTGLKWRDWGSPRARATGTVLDVTCLGGCTGSGNHPRRVPVKVVLSDLVRREGVSFYGHLNLVPVHPPLPYWLQGNDSTDLEVPDA
ncbi:hypothetical protein [Streptomyces graminilatus]|uniref:hypothetical protein n=1 Tax=Streptomyces graminilatus TaxID=1464070 RepID=UPI0006E1ECC2|nr:hypothetical protein [Streptomyces graminilatus]